MPTPQHCPTPRELADLELLTGGALAPVTGFNEPGSPVTLDLPADLAGQEVELVDPEGLPLARLAPDGTVEALTHAQHGPFRRLHLTPAQVREAHAGATFVPVVDALTEDEIERLRGLGTPVVLLALTGPGTPELSPVALLRASLAAARRLPEAAVVAVPLASHGDADVDHDLGVHVVAAYAGPDPVLALGDGDGDYPDDIAAIVEADQPGPAEQGLVLFFTGLSGSGKSTVAQAVIDALLEHGERTVTSLDGDVVRRNLSAGLTFSREDRETNIRRIGWVAAEISRHGGRRGVQPDRAVRRHPAGRPRDDRRRRAARSSWCTSPRRSRSASGATARASTPRRAAARSPTSPASRPPTRCPTTPTSASTPPGARSTTAATRCSTALAAAGFVSGPAVDGRRSGEPVAARGEPIRVLFVCTANICRSPYLELRARQLLGPDCGRRGQQRRHPRLRRLAGQRHDGGGVRPVGHRDRRLPQPAGDRRADRRGRPRAHRRGGPPHPAARGPARRPSARSSRSGSSWRARRRPTPSLRGRDLIEALAQPARPRPRPTTTSPTPTGVAPRPRARGRVDHGGAARGRRRAAARPPA